MAETDNIEMEPPSTGLRIFYIFLFGLFVAVLSWLAWQIIIERRALAALPPTHVLADCDAGSLVISKQRGEQKAVMHSFSAKQIAAITSADDYEGNKTHYFNAPAPVAIFLDGLSDPILVHGISPSQLITLKNACIR